MQLKLNTNICTFVMVDFGLNKSKRKSNIIKQKTLLRLKLQI